MRLRRHGGRRRMRRHSRFRFLFAACPHVKTTTMCWTPGRPLWHAEMSRRQPFSVDSGHLQDFWMFNSRCGMPRCQAFVGPLEDLYSGTWKVCLVHDMFWHQIQILLTCGMFDDMRHATRAEMPSAAMRHAGCRRHSLVSYFHSNIA